MSDPIQAINQVSISEPILPASSTRMKLQKSYRQWINYTIGAVLPLTIIAVWQLVSSLGWTNEVFLPSPLQIAAAFQTLIQSGELLMHLSISVERAAFGFFIGGSSGFLLGLAIGFLRRLEYVFDPTIQILRLLPHLALAPIILLWFGFGEESKVVIIAFGAFFPMYINTFIGIRSTDAKLLQAAQVLGFNRTTQLLRVTLPSALPNVLLGFRLSVAISWLSLVVAELVGSQEGVGFLINYGKQNSSTDLIFVGVIIFAVVGKLIDSLVRLLESRWLRWRENYQG